MNASVPRNIADCTSRQWLQFEISVSPRSIKPTRLEKNEAKLLCCDETPDSQRAIPYSSGEESPPGCFSQTNIIASEYFIQTQNVIGGPAFRLPEIPQDMKP